MTNEDEVIEYHPQKGFKELDNTKQLTDLVGQVIIISNVQFFETPRLKIAKVTTDKGDYRTTSEVLLKQLEDIKKITDTGKKVKVKLTKKKRYYTFE
jgi:hypothetical protein